MAEETKKKATTKSAGAAKPLTRKKKTSSPSIAVFIDIENTNASRDNLTEVFTALAQKGAITYGKFYGYRFDKAANFDEFVAEHRLETVGRMRVKDGADSVVDTRLVVDCMLAVQKTKYDFVFVWAGVGDLMSLFASIKQLGSKVITVDLPVFDCNNKFVDQKIKLFSTHSLKQALPIAAAPTASFSAATSAPAAMSSPISDIMAGRVIPQLPRKKGAPEFGKSVISSSLSSVIADGGDGEGESAIDFNNMDLSNMTDEELEELVASLDDNLDDFDDLDGGGSAGDAVDNERLSAITDQMIRAMMEGRKIDTKDAIKKYEKSATAYDPGDSNEAPSDKLPPDKNAPDEFSDFGKL